MSRAFKAALLSALVFPGLGHFYLKRPLTGAILVVVALASLYVMLSGATEAALQITDQIQRGDAPLDLPGLTRMLEQQSDGGAAGAASMGLLISWVLGIFDAYRVGRARDGDDAA